MSANPSHVAQAEEKPAAAQSNVAATTGQTAPPAVPEPVKMSTARFVMIFLCLMLSIFLFALDQLIVATAIPKITDAFDSLTEVLWLANGFFITLLGFNLAFAQWLAIFPSKHILLFAIFIFELGSLICGVAPSMEVLISGRAVAGVGGAGLFNGATIVLTEMTSFADRARWFGLLGAGFAVASVLGPLIGGAFSDHVSWRWCFYINLPIGGLVAGCIVLLVETRAPYGRAATYKGYSKPMLIQLLHCDWFGIALVLSWAVVFILALQWGGVTKSWSDGNVIACLVMIPVLAAGFVGWEAWMGERAMLPLHILRHRDVAGAAVVAVFTWSTFMIAVYYLSEGFQAVYHSSATSAGISLLPLIICEIFVLITSGRLIARLGRSHWLIVAGPVFLAVGSGLMYSVEYPDKKEYYMGYSALIGVGIGLVLQNTIIAVQYVFSKQPKLISVATGSVTFFSFIGRIFGVSLAGSVFENMLAVNLKHEVPGIASGVIANIQASPNAVWDGSISEAIRPHVLHAYTHTLSSVFLIGVPVSIVGLAGALVMRDVKMDMNRGAPAAVAATRKEEDVEAGSVAMDRSGKDDDAVMEKM